MWRYLQTTCFSTTWRLVTDQDVNVITKRYKSSPWHIQRDVALAKPGNAHINQLLAKLHSFRPVNGKLYLANIFPSGKARSPEFVTGEKATSRPLKADSLYLGQLICFILTHSYSPFPSSISSPEDAIEEYQHGRTKLYRRQAI
ncbi:hypothetical protein X797_007728 [Metarhizium robertsii]|uniref:Uncharacterized protein n=1 Tax=Metarhizium robertsii TaxID=568076 RepID=A0A014PP37_9HYPO|nr:hypothetical protein X797_007728 [Metarhizium robertsii]